MPNFLVIGAAKSGTTSLYHYLAQHPDVFMSPVKEPNFFALEGEKSAFRAPGADQRINRWSITNVEAYRRLFEGVAKEKAIGEASPLYLYSPRAPGRIRHHVPGAKLIAVLRDPAERAYSSFLHLVRLGRETIPDFAQALDAEDERVRDNWEWIWHYKRMGFYHEQLSRYYETFGRDQVRVYLYEDLNGDPVGVVRDAYGFLGVDDSFAPDVSHQYMKSGVPKSRTLYKVLREPHPIKSVLKHLFPKDLRRRTLLRLQNRVLVRPPFPAEARRELKEAYREDVLKLQGLIGRDLSGWLR